MNVASIQSYNYSNNRQNGISFEKLGIKIKGKMFEKHPDSVAAIKKTITDNLGITDFFKTHDGKIVVESKTATVRVMHDYPICIRTIPSSPYALPCDQFPVDESIPVIHIRLKYNRPRTLTNWFPKPVLLEGGTQKRAGMTWNECVDRAKEVIGLFGKDSEAAML